MDEQALAGIIERRKTLEEYVKYVGVYCLEGRQALILGQTCYDDLSVVSHVSLDIPQRDGSSMIYSSKNYGSGTSPFLPLAISQLDDPFEADFYNQGMQMLSDAGVRLPEDKRGYPEITAWKDELLKRERLTIAETVPGRYYALIDHEHEGSCRRIDVLRMGEVLDYAEGIFIPGEHEYLLTASVQSPARPGRGAFSFYINCFDSPEGSVLMGQQPGDVFIFSYGYFNIPEQEHGALNITDWWKAEYGATDGKFIPVGRDELVFLQENALVRALDLVEHFSPRFLWKSGRMQNERRRTGTLRLDKA